MSWDEWLAARAQAREDAGLTRRLRPRDADDPMTDLAGNDYLGLSGDPRVRAAAAAAAESYGAGAGASRLVTGTLDLHAALEAELAEWMEQPAGLVFSTGYHANLGVVTALADRSTRVISDAHVHASLIDAIRLSRAAVSVVPHNDVDAVRQALAGATEERVLVVVESIYSVLGDAAPLAELARLCGDAGALLVVDEAHGLGVHGRGLVASLGLGGLPHVVVTATLSKALGAQGGAVLGSAALREHLVNTARPFIFDTGLAPAATGGALAALRIARTEPWLGIRVLTRVRELADALGVIAPDGAVLSVPMSSPTAAVEAQAAALRVGLRVGCFRPPSVPDGVSRLRITASAGVPEDEWRRAVDTLITITKEHS
ncbi:MAG: 8-amino-7-oxononanoate synthase [Nocardioidaceae bacterium]|nr:8-amino-7-oxononanoate synthase [Nocardioidaceae bacterium]MCL2612638.1 8-amino-7-oxononanoate synthase [Nocardioidaceae bacterium]